MALPASEELTALARQENASDRIRAIGRCPSGLLPHLYRTAAFLVYPSLFEGFGLPPLEAMACGTAVAATNAGAVPEVLQDNALYFEPRDVDSIATALGRLARDPSLRETLAKRGSVHAARFSWERTTEQTVRAIQQSVAV
jgi:glycosyltransferase involved in cell wall biosynthesis